MPRCYKQAEGYPEIKKKYVSKLCQDVEMRIMCLSIYRAVC